MEIFNNPCIKIISIKEKIIPIRFNDDYQESIAEFNLVIEILAIKYQPIYSITINIDNDGKVRYNND